MNVDFLQHVKRALSGFNQGVKIGIVDATVSGANTFAVLRARVAALTGLDIEEQQTLQMIVLPALDDGNLLGTLTDARLNGLTTVAAVRALFTADDNTLAADYCGMNLE
jgi:hypothetical protein